MRPCLFFYSLLSTFHCTSLYPPSVTAHIPRFTQIHTKMTLEFFSDEKAKGAAANLRYAWSTIPTMHKEYMLDDLIREWQLMNLDSSGDHLQVAQFLVECHCIILFMANVVHRRNHIFHCSMDIIHAQLLSTLKYLDTVTNVTSQFRVYHAIITWTRGRHFVLLITIGHVSMRNNSAWQSRLRQMQVIPHTYTAKWFQHQFVVYLKIAAHRQHYYIGSTSVSMHLREEARQRKLQQMHHQTFVSCEVALRYWHHTKTTDLFVPIVIQHATSRTHALSIESNFILTYQPQLNYPFIIKFLPSSASNEFKTSRALKSQSIRNHRTGLRVLKRLRGSDTNTLPRSAKQHILNDLYDLGTNTIRRFRVMRKLWSPKLSRTKFYTYVRLTTHMDAKYKPRAVQALQRIARRQQWEWPRNPFPLIIPFLAQPSFKRDTQQFLQQHLHRIHATLIPFHWPPTKIVEGKHQQIMDALHNWRGWYRQFLLKGTPTCECQAFLSKYPGSPTVDGHIAGGLADFPIPKELQEVVLTSAKDSYYPGKNHFKNNVTKLFHKWADRNACSSPLPSDFVNMVWDKHQQHIQHRDLHSFKAITQIRAMFRYLVVHCEDHHPTKLCAFCPSFYHQVIQKMVQDPVVFGQLDIPPTHMLAQIFSIIPRQFLINYPWAFKLDARLPSCYGLLKKKKDYRKARPIVSYSGTVFAPFFTMIGKLLSDLLEKTIPTHMGSGNITQVFHKIHNFLQHNQEAAECEVHNDDLVGFFVSVPHERIIQSIRFLVSQYITHHIPHTQDPSSITFTVDLRKLAKFRTIRGKAVQHTSTQHVFALSDLIPAVQLSLTASYFECMGKLYYQKQGSSIGSQCSPAICATVVAVQEAIWMRAYNLTFQSRGLFVRYVDNRLICVPKHVANQTPFQILLALDFYGMPIELEECGSMDILGFTLNTCNKTCSFNFPTEPHQFRHPKSAGSERKILSGFESRLHLIYTRTYPRSDITAAVQRLISLYQQRGFTPSLLHVIRSNVHRTLKCKTKHVSL